MSIRFRKSKKIGPLRLNVSKSGLGYSFGSKVFRVTKKSNGGTRYTSTIPGTGVSFVNETKKGGSKKHKKPNFKAIGIGFLALLVIGAIFPSNKEESPEEDPQVVIERVTSRDEQKVETVGDVVPIEKADDPKEKVQERRTVTQDEQDVVVYITETGKHYHSNPNCGKGNYLESTLKFAERTGLTPCSKCY